MPTLPVPDIELSKTEMHRLNIRVSPEMYVFFKEKCARTGISMSALIFMALEQHIQQANVADMAVMFKDIADKLDKVAELPERSGS